MQVRGYVDMAKHYSSGWFDDASFRKQSEEQLRKEYQDTAHIWEKDYLTKEEIEQRINNLQNEMSRLQQMLN